MRPQKDDLVKIIEDIRVQRCCAYTSPHFCDCKYGGEHIGDALYEDTGCPELRYIAWLLQKMTDEEYQHLSQR